MKDSRVGLCGRIIKSASLGIIITFVLQFGLLSCGQKCTEQSVKEIMGDWYKKKIVFPDNVVLINDAAADSARPINISLTENDFYIVHFFMADCDKCVHELLDIQKFILKHKDSKNVKYLFIASGPTMIYAQEAIRNSEFILPVYYEKDYFSFKNVNHLPVTDKLYNTMLLNDKQEVILFGELFYNTEAEELFFNIINQCK